MNRPPPVPVDPHLGAADLAAVLIVNIAFGLNLVAMKVVVDATAPFLAVAVRMAIVFLLCARGFRGVPGRNGWLALYGLLNGGLFLLVLNLSLMATDNVGALAIAGQLGVPFSLLLGAIILGERLSGRRVFGVAIAFAGVVMLVFDPHAAHELKGLVLMATASFLWGSGTLIQRKLGGISIMTIQSWNGLMAAIVLAPFAFAFERDAIAALPDIGLVPLAWLGFSCVIATVIGQGLLAHLLQRHPISSVMPLLLLSPVIGVAGASLYFGTPITAVMVAGGLITLGGVALLTLSGRRPPDQAGT